MNTDALMVTLLADLQRDKLTLTAEVHRLRAQIENVTVTDSTEPEDDTQEATA